jgi:hypothetical protein
MGPIFSDYRSPVLGSFSPADVLQHLRAYSEHLFSFELQMSFANVGQTFSAIKLPGAWNSTTYRGGQDSSEE